jgi:hypothetical protein
MKQLGQFPCKTQPAWAGSGQRSPLLKHSATGELCLTMKCCPAIIVQSLVEKGFFRPRRKRHGFALLKPS